MSTRDDIDQRVYVILHPAGDYFLKWESTGWETVKRFAHWTNDLTKAAQFRLDDLPRSGWIDLVCGFAGLSLKRITIETVKR